MLPPLAHWQKHFESNESNSPINWEVEDILTQKEFDNIKNSIAAFQLGESSEGKHLIQAAKNYAQKYNDPYLITITRLFIKEEQGHALLLKRFMDKNKIPTIRKNWSDDIFRKLRKNVGFELSITVLITAEMLSLIYYSALFNATGSKLLKSICEKLVKDEVTHIKYESELLNSIRKEKLLKHLVCFAHQFFYFGTMLVVYLSHHKVLNAGGYNFGGFWKHCWEEFSNSFGQGNLLKKLSRQMPNPFVN
ncbi:MAG: hypothetical protein HY819_15140 [Acidobacteria bacterium]|nr:hypothetical protein [Acidobacteriota bacterium]